MSTKNLNFGNFIEQKRCRFSSNLCVPPSYLQDITARLVLHNEKTFLRGAGGGGGSRWFKKIFLVVPYSENISYNKRFKHTFQTNVSYRKQSYKYD